MFYQQKKKKDINIITFEFYAVEMPPIMSATMFFNSDVLEIDHEPLHR